MTEHQKTPPHATGSTRQNGAPAVSDRQSLTVGSEGPIVLHDTHLVETHQHFNRMNIPERRPHAKGSGAFGEFEVTEDVSKYTKALVFQPGAKTETLLRFSTVAGELGSPDTWRDVRGFALRFYTDEGNLDVTPSPTSVVSGVPVELTATWSGLEAATRYLGAIGYDFGAGEAGYTLVTVTP